MRRSKLQEALESGESVAGVFAPVAANFETPAVLTWAPENGAELQLASLEDDWPRDFGSSFTVHGRLYRYPEPVTLMESRITRTLDHDRPANIKAQVLALGEHTDSDCRWPVANYSPSGLHEWHPETGLSIDHPDDNPRHPRVSWKPPATVSIPVPDAEIQINPGADWSWGFGPTSRIDTTMKFTVRPDQPQTIDGYWTLFRIPLLSFVVFASDRPDDMTWESFYDPASNRQIVVLRAERRSFERDWRPNAGHFLFKAADLDREVVPIQRWVQICRTSEPSLGLYGETIQEGQTYSPSRFLTLYTAAEGYWKATKKAGETNWGIDALAARAALPESVTSADKDARALIGRLRRYHAHLKPAPQLTPEEISHGTFESTRRLHVLMQACLMREIGLDTDRITALIESHYRSWPIP